MKTVKRLIVLLLLAAALAACQMPASKPATPFPLPSATPSLATATPAPYTISPAPDTATSEPPTPTPEIFIAKTQAIPGDAPFSLPQACLVAGSSTYVDRTNGYCFAFPAGFTFERDSGITITSGPLDNSPDPLIVSAGILVQPAGDQTIDALISAYLQEFVGANPPWDIPSAVTSIGGESARMLEPVPGRGSSRVVIVLHNQSAYRLTFFPSPLNPDHSQNGQSGDPVYDKFVALSSAVQDSFSFLGSAGNAVDVPLKCLEAELPFSFDPTSGECSAVPTPQPTAIPTTTPTTAPVAFSTPDPNQNLGDLRFEDRFDGSNGWLWGYIEEGVVSFTQDNGAVLARLEAADKGWRISLGPDAFTAGDQQVQLTARSEICADQDEWGLLFRGALNSNDKFDGYVVKLNCAGQVSVDRLTNNKSASLLGWTIAEAAKAGAGVENTLLVWADTSELRIYVNGAYVVTIQDTTYPSGEYGLFVNDRTHGNAQFRFTDLRVFDIIH
jgi:hypothetical protein